MRPFFRSVWFISRLPRVAPQIVVPCRLKSTSAKKTTEESAKKSTKNSTKKSIKESIEESVKKSTEKSTKKSTKEPVNESVTESVKKLTKKSRPIDLPKLIIAPGSIHHNSLATFLKYVEKQELDPSSTVYKGTHYEYTVALALLRFGLLLERVGRKQDAGIDLIGHWHLEHFPEPQRVFAQCKAQKSINPAQIRELEGALRAIPPAWWSKSVLALLVTTAKATPGVRQAMAASQVPMGYLLITEEGRALQFLWNDAATEMGLVGLGVTLRHTPRIFMTEAESEEGDKGTAKKGKKGTEKFKNTGTVTDIQLTRMGNPIFPDIQILDQENIKLMGEIEHGEIEEIESAEHGTTPKKRDRPKGSKKKPKVGPDAE